MIEYLFVFVLRWCEIACRMENVNWRACSVKNKFELVSSYEPSGDQPKAIQALVDKVLAGQEHQTLLGATGTGKTYTVSNVVKEINRPTLEIGRASCRERE